MTICRNCGGSFDDRYIDTPCPVCGRQYGKARMKNINTKTLKQENLNIPKHYIGKEWSKSILLEDKKNDKNKNMLNQLAGIMETVHNKFANGEIPSRSVLIVAPPRYSKVTWAYSCMQLAQAKGLSVAPLLDTVELKRFMLIAADKPFHELYNLIDYESYLTADVCFVTVTKTFKNQEAYQVILDLLDSRSRKGLPTYIISRYGIDVLAKWDSRGHFSTLKDYHFSEDPNKFPIICQYFSS